MTSPTSAAHGALRIVVADDHPIVREGIRGLIDAQPDMAVVGQAGDGEDSLRTVAALAPDILVVDMSMPGLNGAQVTRRVRSTWPAVRVIALTVHDDSGYVTQLLKAGVSGYVLKRATGSELVDAIRTVAAGGTYLDSRVAGQVVTALVNVGTAAADDAPHALSERESDVLRGIARGFSNKEIATALGISVKTVETYKGRVMDKLGLRGRADMVRYALRQGWLDDEP